MTSTKKMAMVQRRIKQSIECWLLFNDQVLLLEVGARGGKHPAFFQPITGGIKAGETSLAACVREVHEETGLQLDAGALRPLPESYEAIIDEHLTINKTVYFAQCARRNVTINPKEHVGYKWWPMENVPSALHWQSNKDTWKMVAAASR
jgi:dihydroneopterin triphosphate diphosphatase